MGDDALSRRQIHGDIPLPLGTSTTLYESEMRLRDHLNRREQLGFNRHARKAVRAYYNMPRATPNVCNQLIEWKNGDKVGSLEKREAWRYDKWHDWDMAWLESVKESVKESVNEPSRIYRHGNSHWPWDTE